MSKSRVPDEGPNRRAFMRGLLTTAAVAAPVGMPALALGKGNYRTLSLVNHRTAEKLQTVYWIDGEYVPEALQAFNYILRDWRLDLITQMDARTIDVMAATWKLLETSEPFEVISGYRSPQTNAMLRRKSRGVAKNSYHTRGMAVDLTLETRNVRQISSAALSLQAGGVGKYSRSKFVHVDSGPVRDWGR